MDNSCFLHCLQLILDYLYNHWVDPLTWDMNLQGIPNVNEVISYLGDPNSNGVKAKTFQ